MTPREKLIRLELLKLATYYLKKISLKLATLRATVGTLLLYRLKKAYEQGGIEALLRQSYTRYPIQPKNVSAEMARPISNQSWGL